MERNGSSKEAAVCAKERCLTTPKTTAKKTKVSDFLFFGKNGKIEKSSRNRKLFHFPHFSNKSKKIKNSKISLLTVYSIFLFLNLTSKLRKTKNDRFS